MGLMQENKDDAVRLLHYDEDLVDIVPSWSMAQGYRLSVDAWRLLHRSGDLCGEKGDVRRFDNPRQLMAFLGLVPAERVSETLRPRLEGLPKTIRDIAWKTQIRLCARYRRLIAL